MMILVRQWSASRWIVPACILLFVLAIAVTYATVPQGNAGTGPVDVLLVLGTPATRQGAPSQAQQWRVCEAVRQYKAGVAPRILFTGGANANRFFEAAIMAHLAEDLGVPSSAILQEDASLTTIANIRNSRRIIVAHHWTRVEVISTPDHLRRVAVLLATTDLRWRVHAAPTPDRPWLHRLLGYVREALGTALLRWFGTRAEPVNHALASSWHAVERVIRRLGILSE